MSTIQSLSQSCIDSFQNLLSSLKHAAPRFLQLIPPLTIETQLGKFRIWCGNLGALQTGYVSLDCRLRESAVMFKNVAQLLQQLNMALEESISVVSGTRLPFDEESMPSDMSEESTDEDESSNECFSSKELPMRVSSIVDILKNLYRLSYKIRNPTLRPDSTKAALIEEVDDDTGVNLFDRHYEFDKRHLMELFTSIRKGRYGDNRSSDILLERLTTSNVLRRKQFKYWEKHARKLGVELLPVRQKQKQKLLISEALEAAEPLESRKAPKSEEQSHISRTDATPYDPARDDQTERATITSLASTALDTDGKGIEVPKPPKEALNGEPFTCPYCLVLCPAKQGRGKSWKAHVLHDLRPYVCTYEECNRGNEIYQSRKAWVDHEEAVHRPSWRCRDHPDILYASSAGFQSHLLLEHDGDLSRNQIEDLLKISKLGRVDDREICPLCFEQQPFPKGLTNHLANHLERIALFALPTAISNEGMSQDQSQLSVLFNIDSEDSSTSQRLEEDRDESSDTKPGIDATESAGPKNSLLSLKELDGLRQVLKGIRDCLAFIDWDMGEVGSDFDESVLFTFDLATQESRKCFYILVGLEDRNFEGENAHRRAVADAAGYLTATFDFVWKNLLETKARVREIRDSPRKRKDIPPTQFNEFIDALGALRTVSDMVEGLVQILECSIPLATGLRKLNEYQDILPVLLPIEKGSDANENENVTKSVEQEPDETHVTGSPGDAERIDSRYRVCQSHMFQPGEIFKVLWFTSESEGVTSASEDEYWSQFADSIFARVRRFLVVANNLGHCTCVRILTYGKNGLRQKHADPKTHGIVYEPERNSPRLLKGEPEPGFAPIRVHMYEQSQLIRKESRVNYAKLITVEHNVKVHFIGRVVGEDWEIVTDAVNTCRANNGKTVSHKKISQVGEREESLV